MAKSAGINCYLRRRISRTGLRKRLTKNGTLPEAYSDMIFAAFSEEIGFVGNMLLFRTVYGDFFFTVLKQLSQVRDPQLKTLAIGIISLIIVQVFCSYWGES